MREAVKVGEYWFDSHNSAEGLMRSVVTFCEAGGFDWRTIQLSRKSG